MPRKAKPVLEPREKPFLEVITRTFGQRGTLLDRCKESVALLGPEVAQRILVDEGARGVAWANHNLATVEASGEWVWVIDDDDLVSDAGMVEQLRRAAEEQPDVVMVRVVHGKWGMLPPGTDWGHRPIMGRIGGSCAIVRGEVWNKFRHAWQADYAGDFWFINTLWDAGLAFSWLPVIAAYQPWQNNGAGE